jgi:hypothetical protein
MWTNITLAQALVFAAAITAAITAATPVAVRLFRVLRKWGHLVDDLIGEPKRPGQDPRPGLMDRVRAIEITCAGNTARLQKIEDELHPNGGETLRDAVDRVERAVQEGG